MRTHRLYIASSYGEIYTVFVALVYDNGNRYMYLFLIPCNKVVEWMHIYRLYIAFIGFHTHSTCLAKGSRQRTLYVNLSRVRRYLLVNPYELL